MGKTIFGVVLLLIGSLIFFNVIGLGWFFRVAAAAMLLVYAVKKIKRGATTSEKGIGFIFLFLGLILLVGGIHVLFGIFVGASLIYVGYKQLKKDNARHSSQETLLVYGNSSSVYEDAFDLEWNKKMKK